MKSIAGYIFSRIVNAILVCTSVYGVYLGYQLWLERSRTFHIDKILVSGIEYFTKDEILEMGEIPAQASIWIVPLVETTEKIESHPFINSVHISRKFPDILKVTVHEKEPIATLNFQDRIFFLDGFGMVLPNIPGKAYDLPMISGAFEGGVMEGYEVDNVWIDEGLKFVQIIQSRHPVLSRNVSEIIVGEEEGMKLNLRQNALPVYLGRKDRIKKIYALEAVLNDLEKKGQLHMVTYINLKFTNQVIVGMGA